VTKVRFGVAIPTSGAASSSQRIVESAIKAEELGYDIVFANDHVHYSPERHKLWQSQSVGMGSYKDAENTLVPNQFEIMTTFSYLAAKTSDIGLAIAVMPVLLRDPVILAKEIATVDELSGGRLAVGVGVSNVTDIEEFNAVGKNFGRYAERYEMLGEYVEAMREIWENERASFHGKYVNIENLVVYPKPRRHVPILIGAHTLGGGADRPPVKFALEHADGWIYGFRMKPLHMETMISEFKATAKKAGKNLRNFDWCFQLRLSTGRDDQEARTNSAWMLQNQAVTSKFAAYTHTANYLQEKTGMQKNAPKNSLEWMAIGRPDKILKEIEAYIDSGVTSFELFFSYSQYDKLLDQMRIFSKEVIPSVR
jgi:alkanesulfonate monooxygenase SsuD/methylene tetrahydromethanopterin reductase-like flavin-dependent oxidoreductase (luciferase family)